MGLRISLDKKELISVGRADIVEELASELGCLVGSLPSSYLGFPLVASYKSMVAWDCMEKRLHKRLSMWKKQYISKGGRIILIFVLFCLTCLFVSSHYFAYQGWLD